MATMETDVKKMKPVTKPPVAKSRPTKTGISLHGYEHVDEYAWLRDRENPEVMNYLEQENGYAVYALQHTTELQNKLYNEFVDRTATGDIRTAYTQVDDFFYYSRMDEEQQYFVHYRKFDSLENEEQVVLDENIMAEGEEFFSLGIMEISPDHSLVAFTVDTEGNERFSIKFRNLNSQTDLEDEIYPVGWTVRWAADNKTVLYTQVDEIGRAYKLFRHTIGENKPDGSDDEQIYFEPDPAFYIAISTTNNRKYFLLNVLGQVTTEMYYLPTNQPTGEFQLIIKRERGVLYYVTHHANYFYFLTNEGGAYNFKVVTAPISDPTNKELWEEVIPHREDVVIDKIIVFRHHFVSWQRENGIQKVLVQDLSDLETHYIQFPESLYSIWPGEVEDTDDTLTSQYFNSNLLRFSYSSFTQPTIIYDYDMDNRRKKKIHEERMAGFVKGEYHHKRIFVEAEDGAQIPVILVYKTSLRALQGGNPLILTGYGAYGTHNTPTWDPTLFPLLDIGFIYAIAQIRGDSTMGRQWYFDGKFLKKKNTFTDFIACAEHLVNQGYTTPEKLAIWGRSAGGLLVTAVANMRPDLFKVVVADVPFVDVIGSMSDGTIPWTAFEWEEWGDPRSSKEYFDYMQSYCPYSNIESKPYPHMLITTGLNDTRVAYWEPAKYVARMRKATTGHSLILLKTYLAGHMGVSGRFDAFESLAFKYAFTIANIAAYQMISDSRLLKVIAPSPTAITPVDLLAMFQGYRVSMSLYAGIELGLFEELHSQPNFRAEFLTLVKNLNVSKRGLRRLLDVLVSLGLLSMHESGYALTDTAANHLVKGMPGCITDLKEVLITDYQWNAIRTLTEVVRTGRPSVVVKRRQKVSSVLLHQEASILLNSSWTSRRKNLHVLDYRCSSGMLGILLAQKLHNIHVRFVEEAEELEEIRNNAKVHDIPAEKVSFVEKTDFEEDNSLPAGTYDAVIIGKDWITTLGYNKAADLLSQVSAVLSATGRVIFCEALFQPENPYIQLHSLSLLVTRPRGKVHELSWFEQLLQENGFASPTIHDLHPFPEKLLISVRNILKAQKGGRFSHIEKLPAHAVDAHAAYKPMFGEITVLLEDPAYGNATHSEGEEFRVLKQALEGNKFKFLYYTNHREIMDYFRQRPPQFVLNLCTTGWMNDETKDFHIPALMEMLSVPYSGASPRSLIQCRDNTMLSAAAQSVGCPFPNEIFIRPSESTDDKSFSNVTFPAIVKPNRVPFSTDEHCYVTTEESLKKQIHKIRKDYPGCSLVVQEYLPGKELIVGVIGNVPNLTVLPILELDFGVLPAHSPKLQLAENRRIAGKTELIPVPEGAASLDTQMEDTLVRYSKLLFERLECRDYATFSFRIAADGVVKILEVSPNPWVGGRLRKMAALAKKDFPHLMGIIIHTAMERYKYS